MVDEYVAKLSAVGFTDVRTRLGDDDGDRGFTSAYVEAERPIAGGSASAPAARAVPRASCCSPGEVPEASKGAIPSEGTSRPRGCCS